MIYGDEIKIKEYRDYLGLNTYTVKLIDYAAVRQSGNLYGYCLNNTLVYIDSNGEELFAVFALGVVALTSIILTGCSMTSDEAKRRGNHNNSYNGSSFTVTLDTLTFSDKFYTSAYSTQISDRGWSNELIVSTINNPFKALKSAGYNKYTGNTVTYYYIDEDSYVAVDDGTHKVIQISDRNKKEWKNNDYQK